MEYQFSQPRESDISPLGREPSFIPNASCLAEPIHPRNLNELGEIVTKYDTYHALSDRLALPTYAQATLPRTTLWGLTNIILLCINIPSLILLQSRISDRGKVSLLNHLDIDISIHVRASAGQADVIQNGKAYFDCKHIVPPA